MLSITGVKRLVWVLLWAAATASWFITARQQIGKMMTRQWRDYDKCMSVYLQPRFQSYSSVREN
jgi:hypothetical protein